MKLLCSAVIANAEERKSVLEWIRNEQFNAYSEIGETIYATYETTECSPEANARKWGIIHAFEQYPQHSITINN